MAVIEETTTDGVRVIRLNRPERKNALTAELGWAVVRAVHQADADDDVRVIAITGNGYAFCSGLDLGPGERVEIDTGMSAQQLRGLDSEDGQEAVKAIMEKRAPSFQGR